jgi:hypothetical protein
VLFIGCINPIAAVAGVRRQELALSIGQTAEVGERIPSPECCLLSKRQDHIKHPEWQ